jgi:hypothetical protein
MSDLHTWMRHSDHGGEAQLPTALIDHFEARGWVVMDEPPVEDEGHLKDAAEAEAEFDPSEHTVAEVQDHMAEYPDDADRVLDAEAAGKNRVTLTGDTGDDAE